jgi:hypothetical protein
LIDHSILACPFKAAEETTATTLVTSALLLVVAAPRIFLIVAGVHLSVVIASHLAFKGLLAFAEEGFHAEGWGGLSNGG